MRLLLFIFRRNKGRPGRFVFPAADTPAKRGLNIPSAIPLDAIIVSPFL